MTTEEELKKTTKRSLRIMRRANEHHPLRNKMRIIKYGAKGFLRNISLSIAATIVMVIALVVVSVTVVANVILTNSANEWYDKIAFSVYLKPDVSEETLEELVEIAKSDPNTKSVSYRTSADEYKRLLEKDYSEEELAELGVDEETLTMTSENMYSTMEIKAVNADDMESIEKLILEDELFQQNLDTRKEPSFNDAEIRARISRIMQLSTTVRIIGIAVVLILLAIAILVIYSTVRMAIFSRREEIYMMKLVGADKKFIRGPFLIEAEISGIIAGLISSGICIGGFVILKPWFLENDYDVSQITNIIESWQVVLVVLAFVLIGILIGRISAWLAVSKYLHKM